MNKGVLIFIYPSFSLIFIYQFGRKLPFARYT